MVIKYEKDPNEILWRILFQKSMIHRKYRLRGTGYSRERVSEVEDRVIEITQTKKQKYVTSVSNSDIVCRTISHP